LRLLVSVADAVEARAALEGCANIIDAKDPANGALGRVSVHALHAIREAVPSGIPLSAALGEAGMPHQVAALFAGIDVPLSFVKLGILGLDSATCARSIADAVARVTKLPGEPRLVVVAFADVQGMAGLSLAEIAELAVKEGADGLLVDTASKASGSLFDYSTPSDLRDLQSTLPGDFSFAVAGSLKLKDMAAAIETDADVVGVRGAACEAGRASQVSSTAVAGLVETLRRAKLNRPDSPPAARVASAPIP
jgi:(5-formylfuran-3-yl)methyl phosphate synthase